MTHPWVVDGGVAANILNKQSWTADKGWSSSFWVGQGANNPSSWKTSLLWNVTHGLWIGRLLRTQ